MKEFGLIIKLVLAIFLIAFLGDMIPEGIQRAFYTISIIMKETLVFFMPLIVFAFIMACLSSFQSKGPLLIVMLLGFVILSNFLFIQVGYVSGDIILPLMGYNAENAKLIPLPLLPPLEPYFSIPYPRLISTDMALLAGTVGGLYGAFWEVNVFQGGEIS